MGKAKTTQYQTDLELKELVKNLFSQPQCPQNLKNKGNQDKPKVTMVGTSGLWAIPRNKVNKYDSRLYGWGPSAYLFDYLDPVLEAKTLKIFNDLWKEVSTITSFPSKEDKDDLYTLQRIFNMPDQTEAVLLEKFKALKPSFKKMFGRLLSQFLKLEWLQNIGILIQIQMTALEKLSILTIIMETEDYLEKNILLPISISIEQLLDKNLAPLTIIPKVSKPKMNAFIVS